MSPHFFILLNKTNILNKFAFFSFVYNFHRSVYSNYIVKGGAVKNGKNKWQVSNYWGICEAL